MTNPDFDTLVAHPARRYDYWLGGKDNFAADRASGDAIERAFPGVRDAALANRGVLRRAVHHLAAAEGIRQFLDIGTGLPTANNTHEVAQAVAPESRIVYVDNDPLVLSHARALLTTEPEGATAYLEADLRDPADILAHPSLARTLDLARPVALMLVAVLHFIPGRGAAAPLVRQLLEPLAPGSFLVLTHATADFMSPAEARAALALVEQGKSDFWLRDRAEIEDIFAGLELIDPGIVPNSEWRPDADTRPLSPQVANCWAGVARKP
ncbi:SAM-dependent methyltransferase [Actinoplanes sp. RD1]|uniref:SAM-dependent methyltransferase n=1 Tax=Actinoplanes sp. RD1 TaxID=3064538 RepID=UPI0027426689|nr:SAM-dependent methyltransferase [Actinoplanes sp. RD1]